MNHLFFRNSRVMRAGFVGLILIPCPSVALAAEPVVGWREVQSAVDAVDVSGKKSVRVGSESRGVVANGSLERVGPGLPPPPRGGVDSAAVHVQPMSLAGISSSVVPAVTGDLYWSRPVLDMRVIGQSLGQNSSLRLAKPPVGVSVGSTSTKPALVGIK